MGECCNSSKKLPRDGSIVEYSELRGKEAVYVFTLYAGVLRYPCRLPGREGNAGRACIFSSIRVKF